MDLFERIDAMVDKLKAADWKERDAIKEAMIALCREGEVPAVLRHLDTVHRSLTSLELRWEIDEVVEAITPPPEPEPEPEEEEAPEPEEELPADGQLRMSDLKEVYADPRGLALFTDKSGKRWFASQVDPRTGQPQLFELSAAEIDSVKVQLKGSPYWHLGSGVVP